MSSSDLSRKGCLLVRWLVLSRFAIPSSFISPVTILYRYPQSRVCSIGKSLFIYPFQLSTAPARITHKFPLNEHLQLFSAQISAIPQFPPAFRAENAESAPTFAAENISVGGRTGDWPRARDVISQRRPAGMTSPLNPYIRSGPHPRTFRSHQLISARKIRRFGYVRGQPA